MEDFIYNEKLYGDIEELSEDLFETEEDIFSLPEDWEIECEQADAEPIFKFDLDWIMDRIDEERFTEDGYEYEDLESLLCDNINFDIINKLMPLLWYG